MIDQYAVTLALKYLDESLASSKQPTLVDMLEYVDYYGRLVLVPDEVNELLKQRPSLCIETLDDRIVFKDGPGRRELTEEDLRRETQAYQARFWARYKELTGDDPPDPKTLGSNGPW